VEFDRPWLRPSDPQNTPSSRSGCFLETPLLPRDFTGHTISKKSTRCEGLRRTSWRNLRFNIHDRTWILGPCWYSTGLPDIPGGEIRRLAVYQKKMDRFYICQPHLPKPPPTFTLSRLPATFPHSRSLHTSSTSLPQPTTSISSRTSSPRLTRFALAGG
jgi:hypothetical protein